MTDSTSLAGRHALVTGGSTGIGAAVCDRLLAMGARVTSVAIDARPGAAPAGLTQLVADLSDPAAVHALIARHLADGDVDILVNNAGVVVTRPLEQVDDAEFDRLMNLHVRTAILLAQAVAPGMKRRGWGRIVNLASRAIVGMQGRTTYSASKAALIALTRTWALEMGPQGITVNAISPGVIVSPMTQADLPPGGERATALAAVIPRRRLGEPQDVARAVAFFAHPDADWVTGQNLFVCGGSSLATSLPL